MRRISAFSISLLILLISFLAKINAQDTIPIPLKIKVGVEVSGPAAYISDKNILNTEAYISTDINEKFAAVLAAGFLKYKYSQYNYDYQNKGAFVRAGVDINLLKPEKSLGKYWVGIGLRYGLSMFNSEVPSYKHDNYWGPASSSIAPHTYWGHFIEASPGVRTEIFKNVSIGWTLSLRMLLYTGTGKDLKPIYFPGFGNATKTISTGLNYFIVWNIPYKKINVITKKEVQEEPEDTENTENTGNTNNSTNTGNTQRNTMIRP
jgi:hypothetical protein